MSKAPEYPTYELTSYEPIELELPSYTLREEGVLEAMKAVAAQQNNQYIPADHDTVQEGDLIRIKMAVSDSNGPIEVLTADSRMHQLGIGNMPEGFDQGLLGMKTGEERTFTFEAPTFGGAPGDPMGQFSATITLIEVLQRETPELTDVWVAEHLPQYGTLAMLRQGVEEALRMQADQQLDEERYTQSGLKLMERFNGEISDYWYEVTGAEMRETFMRDLQANGMTMEDYKNQTGMSDEQINMHLMVQTREVLIQGFALDAWARHYEIEATDQDLINYANMMTRGNGMEAVRMMQDNGETERLADLRRSALRMKAKDHLIATATVKQL